MTNKLSINQLSNELADRARKAFTGVVTDLDNLLSTLSEKLDSKSVPQKKELLSIISRVRKSLDSRLSSLEKAVRTGSAKKAVTSARKVSKKAASTVKKATKSAGKASKKVSKSARKSSASAKKTARKTVKKATKTVRKTRGK